MASLTFVSVSTELELVGLPSRLRAASACAICSKTPLEMVISVRGCDFLAASSACAALSPRSKYRRQARST